jgi:hypothetical protein
LCDLCFIAGHGRTSWVMFIILANIVRQFDDF